MRPVIGLVTDFGLKDHYVGVMKAVIAGIAPEALVIDIAHDIPPQSVLAGQRALRAAAPYFPAGSILLAVVDPGVGGSRRAMALQSGHLHFVGPDNGLFTPWLSTGHAVELTDAAYRLPRVSSTFHARDIFAPAAAHLALGVTIDRLGPPLEHPIHLFPPEPISREDGTIVGEIAGIDRFGNLVTNIQDVHGGRVEWRGRLLPVQAAYASAAPGELLALIGSDGQIELAVSGGSAAATLGAHTGEEVIWHP